jgi:hypothetical protein
MRPSTNEQSDAYAGITVEQRTQQLQGNSFGLDRFIKTIDENRKFPPGFWDGKQ